MSEIYTVVYSPEALEDIKDIYSYIAYDLLAPDSARSQISRIQKEIRSLDFMPFRYAAVDWEPWKSADMRQVAVGHFIVFYMVDSDSITVSIVRIMYGGRDIETLINSGNESLQ